MTVNNRSNRIKLIIISILLTKIRDSLFDTELFIYRNARFVHYTVGHRKTKGY